MSSEQENRYQNWVMTYHYGGFDSNGNPQLTLEEIDPQLDVLKAKASFYIIGKEIAPTTGQKHLQSYWEFHARQRRTALVKILPTFWDVAKGSADENITYCGKSGTYDTAGTPRNTSQARASGSAAGGEANAKRWKDNLRLTREAKTIEEVLDTVDPQIVFCHYAAIKSIRKDFMYQPPDLIHGALEKVNIWLYGTTGCGKSRKARQDFPGAYSKMCNKWWDGYRGEKYVIIDDFDKVHSVLGHHLKIWGDRYAFVSEDKGGASTLRPEVIVVTSNWSPSEIWSDPETLDPILRRFKVINMSPGPFAGTLCDVNGITVNEASRQEVIDHFRANIPADATQRMSEESDDEEPIPLVRVRPVTAPGAPSKPRLSREPVEARGRDSPPTPQIQPRELVVTDNSQRNQVNGSMQGIPVIDLTEDP